MEGAARTREEDERRNALFLIEQLQRHGEREAVIARRVRELTGEDARQRPPRLRLPGWLRRAA